MNSAISSAPRETPTGTTDFAGPAAVPGGHAPRIAATVSNTDIISFEDRVRALPAELRRSIAKTAVRRLYVEAVETPEAKEAMIFTARRSASHNPMDWLNARFVDAPVYRRAFDDMIATHALTPIARLTDDAWILPYRTGSNGRSVAVRSPYDGDPRQSAIVRRYADIDDVPELRNHRAHDNISFNREQLERLSEAERQIAVEQTPGLRYENGKYTLRNGDTLHDLGHERLPVLVLEKGAGASDALNRDFAENLANAARREDPLGESVIDVTGDARALESRKIPLDRTTTAVRTDRIRANGDRKPPRYGGMPSGLDHAFDAGPPPVRGTETARMHRIVDKQRKLRMSITDLIYPRSDTPKAGTRGDVL